MIFGQLMADIPVYVSCKFEKYIFEIAQVIGENVPIAFLYVLSICLRAKLRKNIYHCKPQFYYIKVGCKGV